MKKCFVPHRFSDQSLLIIRQANKILDEYARQNFRLTLRQLYYQFIARDLLPDEWREDWPRKKDGSKNTLRSYKKLGNIVNDARLAGLMDWDMIEDRARSTDQMNTWENPAELVSIISRAYRIDKWEPQPCHFEVMVEKDAVSGILTPVCHELQIPFTANRGYSSSSMMYDVARRLRELSDKEIHVLYFGDHDPSGLDMTRDVRERLLLFTEQDLDLTVHRLALNMDQVEQWNPPENPAKETDARFNGYRDQFGEVCWELDAVEPGALADLVRDFVLGYRDDNLWDEMVEKEDKGRRALERFANNYREDDE